MVESSFEESIRKYSWFQKKKMSKEKTQVNISSFFSFAQNKSFSKFFFLFKNFETAFDETEGNSAKQSLQKSVY